jgi:hypothetical protein
MVTKGIDKKKKVHLWIAQILTEIRINDDANTKIK